MLAPDERLAPQKSLGFLAIHVAALAVPLLFLFGFPFHWWYPVVAGALYVVRMFGVTAGYHRYFAHRSYKTSRFFQLLLALLGATAAQKGPLWWAGHHRDHHRFSDGERDVHSPVQRGFLWSHVGWILCDKYKRTPTERIRDFARYPELRWLDRHDMVPPIVLAVALFLIGGLPLFLWGFALSTVVLWHGTFLINSLAHRLGSKRYATGDESRNNFALALLTLGEGWHNNHHHYQSSANQGFFWWEIDVSLYALRLLRRLRLVWDLREPPAHIRDAVIRPATPEVAPEITDVAPVAPALARARSA